MKIKNLLLIILIVNISPFSIQGQYFTGEITYKSKVVPKNKNIDIDSLENSSRGDKYTYLITSGYYKTSYFKNDKPTYSYTYHGSTKRMYDEEQVNDYITYRDSRKYDVPILDFKIFKDSTISHLGRTCFLVRKERPGYIVNSYYAEDLKIDYESFKDHEVGNWYENSKKLDGRLALKTITEYDNYEEIVEVVKITPRNVPQKSFELPENKPVYASYQALDTFVDLIQPSSEVIDCYSEKINNTSPPSDGTKRHTVYVEIFVLKDGTFTIGKSLEKDIYDLLKIARDTLKNCGLKFTAGKVGDETVDSITYFPIEFSF